MKNILYKDFVEYETFIHGESFLEDALYNYIIPKVEAEKLNKEEVDTVVASEEGKGISMTYYINESLKSSFSDLLRSNEDYGDDTFISFKLKETLKAERTDYTELSEEDFEEYISLAKECFSDWDNEEFYSRMFLEHGAEKEGKILKTLIFKDEGEIVSFGSVVVDRNLKLGYLHNAGTREESRNRGYFSDITKGLCNIASEQGSDEMYAIVEDGEGSYQALTRLGFEVSDRFYLYATN